MGAQNFNFARIFSPKWGIGSSHFFVFLEENLRTGATDPVPPTPLLLENQELNEQAAILAKCRHIMRPSDDDDATLS